MKYIKKIFSILTKKNKIDFILIVFFSIFKTIFEIIGIGLLIPIFSIISNSEKKNKILDHFFFIDKEINDDKIVILFFGLFIFIYLIKSIYTVFINNYVSKYCQNIYKDLAEKLLKKYLNNKYIFFTHNNSAELIKNVASETNGFAVGSIGACIAIFSNFFLLFGICFFLFFYENQEEWFKHTQSKNFPKFIPKSVDTVYKNKGWEGWVHFLGTSFLVYKKAKKYAQSLKIKNSTEWKSHNKSKNFPYDVPKNPKHVYKNEWKGWPEFFGTDFLVYKKAKKYAQSLKLKSRREWHIFIKSKKLPKNIPLSPESVYKKRKTWKGWPDFLGTGRGPRSRKR